MAYGFLAWAEGSPFSDLGRASCTNDPDQPVKEEVLRKSTQLGGMSFAELLDLTLGVGKRLYHLIVGRTI